MKRIQVIRRSLLAVLVVGSLAFRFIPHAGEFYACRMYPAISTFLSAIASLVPFSLDEWVVVLSLVLLVVFPFWARHRKFRWKRILGYEAECLLWIYVWFYWGWGMNYYRDSFYLRANVAPRPYEEEVFCRFLQNYADRLNASYAAASGISLNDSCLADSERSERALLFPDRMNLEAEVKKLYAQIPGHYGLALPRNFQHPKYLFFNSLYSGVGVLGFMGPFFGESHLNHELLLLQYPFTYAHELSHLLGISNEAEANFWAYQICIRSTSPAVRYSGYFGLLSYVLSNAAATLPEQTWKAWLETIHPAILRQLADDQRYWSERYSPWIGSVQHVVYNWYLKGNRISSGQRNYAEVIGMILSLPEDKWF